MQQDPSYVIYKIGIYGWRKRCLYFFILLILILALVNLGLIIWIMRVQDFSLNGMGKLLITENGVLVNGPADFTDKLRASYITSRQDSPLSIQSTKDVNINARDTTGELSSQIDLKDDVVMVKGKQFQISDENGQSLLYADKDVIRFSGKAVEFAIPGGMKFDTSIETSSISAGQHKTLTLESLTKTLHLNAAQGMQITSNVDGIKLESLHDTSLVSNNGKIILNANEIVMNNLPISDQSGTAVVFPNAKEVCTCPNGRLYLSTPDATNPCKISGGIC